MPCVERKASNKVTIVGEESFNAAPTTDMLQLSGIPFYRIGSRSNAASGGVHAALAKHMMLRSTYTLRYGDFDTNPFTDQSAPGRSCARVDHITRTYALTSHSPSAPNTNSAAQS